MQCKRKAASPAAVMGFIFCSLIFLPLPGLSQAKNINNQTQSWFSVNSTIRVAPHWALVADWHMRRNHFMAENSFYFARAGIQYQLDKNLSLTFGYGHLWLYPATGGWETVAHENRIYQQLQYHSAWRKITMLHRFRNEQRWQQKITDDRFTGDYRFSNRFRYLLSLNIPVSGNKKLPSLSLADELLLQAGREIISNPFDQNRFFLGIRQSLSPALSFDMGYMRVFQQKRTGNAYDRNHTFRLFFYYNPSLLKKKDK